VSRSDSGAVRADVAPTRILDAARRLIASGGLAGASMGEIAAAAKVSKALVHYHFGDKDTLLGRLADDAAHELVDREAHALDGAEGSTAVDALWEWLAGELARGDLRVLGAISESDSPPIREITRRAAERRRGQAAATVERLFELLGLTPRIPPELVAGTLVAFIDGLALDVGTGGEPDPRVSFDVFWLAMLSLAD
jgi:AcrR family transcriptional regulator